MGYAIGSVNSFIPLGLPSYGKVRLPSSLQYTEDFPIENPNYDKSNRAHQVRKMFIHVLSIKWWIMPRLCNDWFHYSFRMTFNGGTLTGGSAANSNRNTNPCLIKRLFKRSTDSTVALVSWALVTFPYNIVLNVSWWVSVRHFWGERQCSASFIVSSWSLFSLFFQLWRLTDGSLYL